MLRGEAAGSAGADSASYSNHHLFPIFVDGEDGYDILCHGLLVPYAKQVPVSQVSSRTSIQRPVPARAFSSKKYVTDSGEEVPRAALIQPLSVDLSDEYVLAMRKVPSRESTAPVYTKDPRPSDKVMTWNRDAELLKINKKGLYFWAFFSEDHADGLLYQRCGEGTFLLFSVARCDYSKRSRGLSETYQIEMFQSLLRAMRNKQWRHGKVFYMEFLYMRHRSTHPKCMRAFPHHSLDAFTVYEVPFCCTQRPLNLPRLKPCKDVEMQMLFRDLVESKTRHVNDDLSYVKNPTADLARLKDEAKQNGESKPFLFPTDRASLAILREENLSDELREILENKKSSSFRSRAFQDTFQETVAEIVKRLRV